MQELNLEDWQDPSVIRAALARKRIAVVGMSSKELRASYFVGFYLFRNGYDVVPVNPRETEILGIDLLSQFVRDSRVGRRCRCF